MNYDTKECASQGITKSGGREGGYRLLLEDFVDSEESDVHNC